MEQAGRADRAGSGWQTWLGWLWLGTGTPSCVPIWEYNCYRVGVQRLTDLRSALRVSSSPSWP